MSFLRVTLAALIVVCLARTPLVAQEPPFAKELLHHDFRGNPALPPTLKTIGPDFDAMNQADDKGMRFTIPKTRKVEQPVGVALTFFLSEDFEITGAYEVMSIDRPPGGPGVGVAINVCIKHDYKKFGKIGRFMLAQKGSAYLAESWDKDVKGTYQNKWDATQAMSGQVRLVRRGSKLQYFVADAPGNVFRQIHTSDFSADDVEMVRFAVNNNGAAAGVDARLIDLKIRTTKQELPQPDAPAAGDPAQPGSRSWLLVVLLLGLGFTLVLAVGVGALIYARQRRSTNDKPQAKTEAKSASLAVSCSGCGKDLKVKPELVGKKVKCPQCGKLVIVPEES